jgi:hypothetical protein
MNSAKQFASCPAKLIQGGEGNRVEWELAPARAARRDNDVDDRYRLIPMDDAGDDSYPVYEQHPESAPAVATGRLFLRLHEGQVIASFAAVLKALGLGVAVPLSWAPNAAWVEALDGSPCHALNRLGELARLEDVAHVEAQLLLALQHR